MSRLPCVAPSLHIFLFMLLSFLGCSGDSPQPVVAVAGQEASLPCNITSSIAHDEIALLLWYKDNLSTPIYSFDTRRSKTGLSAAKHAASEVVAPRARFSADRSPSLLRLKPAQKDDEGEYRCRADFKKARTRYSSVVLRVIAPPKKPVITDETGDILQSLIGPYNEGEELKLICETEGGDPAPRLTWWRESVLLDDTFEQTRHGATRNELMISVLQRHDLMAVFSCQANNHDLGPPLASSVTVDLNFRPLDVRLEYDHKPISAQQYVEMTCRALGSRPPAVISWWKNDVKLKSSKNRISIDGNVTVNTLLLMPTNEDSGKSIICKAENPLILGSVIQDQIKLNVQYAPQLSIRLGRKLRHSHIQEGNDVIFECSVKANPPVSHITWWWEGQELTSNMSAGLLVTNQTLVLQNILRSRAGQYKCGARNKEGHGISNVVNLRVQYAPRCRRRGVLHHGVSLHEKVNVTCEVEADPAPVTFHWSSNGTSEVIESMAVTNAGDRSTATFSLRSERDFGTLLCWASNSAGAQTLPCAFLLFPAGPPEPVVNCTAFNHSEDSFRVVCGKGQSGGLPQTFQIEVFDTLKQILQLNSSASEPSFRVANLPAGSSLSVAVYAVNAKGRSELALIHTSTLNAPENLVQNEEPWRLNFSPVLLVLVSIIVALVAMAFMFIVLVKWRQGRERDAKLARKHQSGGVDSEELRNAGLQGLDERCPDIISDFTLRDDPGQTIVTFSNARSCTKLQTEIE